MVAMEKRSRIRRELALSGEVRTANGTRGTAYIQNLSTHGCGLWANAFQLRQGSILMVRPSGLEGIYGTVKWARHFQAGVEFDRPLYGPVVDHICDKHDMAQSIDHLKPSPLRRR